MDKKPNFFLVGAPKCGTTSLSEYLAGHKNVFFSVPKEPFFWSHDFPRMRQRYELTTLDSYLNLFRGITPEHLAAGEGSTTYLSSEVAIASILEFNPEARFIAMLRNPVESVHSLHQQMHFMFFEDVDDFEQAWGLQEARREGRSIPSTCLVPQFLQYGAMGRYSPHVERLLSLARRDRVMLILFDEFAREPARIYREVLDFLGLPDDGRSEFPRANEAKEHRFRALSRLLWTSKGPVAWMTLRLKRMADRDRNGLASRVRERLRSKRVRPALRPEFARSLREYFAPDVARLSTLLGRDLSHWVAEPPPGPGEAASSAAIFRGNPR